jgi:hypothetical protein
MVNLINHHRTPNVRLRWAPSSYQFFDAPFVVLQESSTQLLLELVAVRDIKEGEEVLLDYGPDWVDAWTTHVERWEEKLDQYVTTTKNNSNGNSMMVQSQEMNTKQQHHRLRTVSEQSRDPYPDNVFTSCFYSYSNRSSALQMEQLLPDTIQNVDPSKHHQKQQQSKKVVTDQWKYSKGIYETRNLRPCLIIHRYTSPAKEQRPQQQEVGAADESDLYTVRIMNHPGLNERERIPVGIHYVVTDIPRRAMQFKDKLYTTDQHLENAFRHHIGMVGTNDGDGGGGGTSTIFPSQWMDLTQQ